MDGSEAVREKTVIEELLDLDIDYHVKVRLKRKYEEEKEEARNYLDYIKDLADKRIKEQEEEIETLRAEVKGLAGYIRLKEIREA